MTPSARLPDITSELIRLGASFHRRGWMLGTSGNLSAVLSSAGEPLRLAITASSIDKGRITPEQILEVQANGQVLNGSPGLRPSAETLVHLEIVQRTGAAAVLHTHSVWSTVLSDVHATDSGFALEGYEMLKGLEGVTTHEHREWIPILENTQDMAALAKDVRGLLTSTPAVHGFLVLRHGLYTWGQSLAEAERHVEILEFLFEARGRRQSMSEFTP